MNIVAPYKHLFVKNKVSLLFLGYYSCNFRHPTECSKRFYE